MSDNVIQISDAEFDAKVLKSSTPVLVDFWAEWCAPCRALTPVIEDLAKTHAGKVQVGKMNIDEQPNTAGKYAVRAIPTMLLFKGGQVVEQIVGMMPKAALKEKLLAKI